MIRFAAPCNTPCTSGGFGAAQSCCVFENQTFFGTLDIVRVIIVPFSEKARGFLLYFPSDFQTPVITSNQISLVLPSVSVTADYLDYTTPETVEIDCHGQPAYKIEKREEGLYGTAALSLCAKKHRGLLSGICSPFKKLEIAVET